MMQDEDDKQEWRLCCSNSDKGFVKYVVQALFGASLMVFSMVQISRSDVDHKEIYFSLLSGTVGLFLPHPTIKN